MLHKHDEKKSEFWKNDRGSWSEQKRIKAESPKPKEIIIWWQFTGCKHHERHTNYRRITTADFSNNETFIIKKVADDIIIISDGHATMEIPTEQFQRCFRVGYCITTYAAQGSTFNEPYTIYEWDRYDLTMKYVAISRSSKKELINMI